MNKFSNTAQAVSFMSMAGSDIAVIATGIDPDAKHFFGRNGVYIGTRFTDGSAVTQNFGGGASEFLSTFHGE
jgi:hypothetical protein